MFSYSAPQEISSFSLFSYKIAKVPVKQKTFAEVGVVLSLDKTIQRPSEIGDHPNSGSGSFTDDRIMFRP